MAKGSVGRIKFAYFEVEGSDETLQEVVKTAVNALRPQVVRPVAPAPPIQAPKENGHGNGSGQLPLIEVDDFETEEETLQKTPAKPKKPRTFKAPEVLEVNLTEGDVPFEEFVKSKGNPDDHSIRYLIIAAWFKEYKGETVITKRHIWTCYRSMHWTTVDDIDGVFRHGKSKGLFTSPSRGEFAITLLGINEVRKMGGGE